MLVAFANVSSYSHFFSKSISIYAIFNDQSFNDTLTNDIFSFEQLVPDVFRGINTLSREVTLSKLLCIPAEKCLLQKERICSSWEQILSF